MGAQKGDIWYAEACECVCVCVHTDLFMYMSEIFLEELSSVYWGFKGFES